MGNRRADRRPNDTRGLWTPEKLRLASRLFGEAMIKVAAQLQVPPKELLEYGLRGVIPPMGEGQRIAQLIEDRSQSGDAPLQLEAPQ